MLRPYRTTFFVGANSMFAFARTIAQALTNYRICSSTHGPINQTAIINVPTTGKALMIGS
jgi:predicted component of type VI protein secretion system